MKPGTSLATLILSPGHFNYFLSDAAREQITRDLQILVTKGILYYLRTEYPESLKKSIIVNNIKSTEYLVDGNRHTLCLYLFAPELKIADIYQMHPHCLRFWQDGYEQDGWDDKHTTKQREMRVWIPSEVDTGRIEDVKIVTDRSKNPPISSKSIPGNIKFDDDIFTHRDRGRKISEASNFLKRKLQIEFTGGKL